MLINEITITNYLCYFEEKKFKFEPGLNLILGDNGDGKTKFFEAIQWLLNGSSQAGWLDLASEMAKHQLDTGNTFRVSVSLKANQFGVTKRVDRFFEVERKPDNSLEVVNWGLQGIQEETSGRFPVEGQVLLDQLFPPSLRKYLMFKGETALNIFDNAEALNILIDTFSLGKYFPKYSKASEYLLGRAQKAVDENSKTNDKNAKALQRVTGHIEEARRLIHKEEEELDHLRIARDSTEKQKSEAEVFVANAESLAAINGKIENIENQLTRKKSQLKQDYTTYLFDDKWILARFEPFQKAFIEKVEGLEKVKRAEEKEFSVELGRKKMLEEMEANVGRVPLPISVPSERYAQEMINECYCKICNRPAPVGSEAYNYMVSRLEDYRNRHDLTNKKAEEEKLFKNNFLKRLLNLSTNQQDSADIFMRTVKQIKETFAFNEARNRDIIKLKSDLEIERGERNKIVSSSSIASERLGNVLIDYNSWVQDINLLEGRIAELENSIGSRRKYLLDLNVQKDKYDRESVDKFLLQTRDILKDVELIFKDTERRLYDEFVAELQERSNKIFAQINTNSFIGKIVFEVRSLKSSRRVNIHLVDDSGRKFSANQSLVTTMHMSILFAISELAKTSATEAFPMIFDAPTSSFGEAKTKQFLNLVSETDQQRIVMFYDFVAKDETGRSTVKKEFKQVKRGKAYLLHLQRPFDRQRLETINTQIEEL